MLLLAAQHTSETFVGDDLVLGIIIGAFVLYAIILCWPWPIKKRGRSR